MPGVGPSPTRRRVLAALAGGGIAGTAGCSRIETFYERDDGSSDGAGGPDSSAGDDSNGDPPVPTPAPETDDLDRESDVRYREPAAGPLHLDLLRPADDVVRPLLVHVHGGGWRRGSKGYEHAERMARAGLVVASVEYRLSDTAAFPAAVRDVVAAVKWLRATAPEHGIDPERVALVGESAGGHLAALLASAPVEPAFQPSEFHPDEPVAVDALVAVSGIYDLRLEGYCTADATEAFLGGTCEERPEDARVASPVAHVDGDHPTTLLYHGTADEVVALEQATTYRDALGENDVDVALNVAEGGGHLLGDDADSFLQLQEAFLAEELQLQ